MKISELEKMITNVNVFNDIDFNALGMATTSFVDEKVLSFLSDEKFLDSILENKNIVAIITTKSIYVKHHLLKKYGIIIVENPKFAFYEIHNQLVDIGFYWNKFQNQISNSSLISSGAFLDKHSIFIGDNTIIEPGVVIHSGTIIGNNVIIRSGCKIGTNGFQFLNTGEKVLTVKTGGRAIIRDNVEIQHNSCVDRGVLGGNTVISEFVKIDNFVHVAHDDFIGERTFITAGVKLAGRVIIGKDCWLGVNSTISNGILIGNKCTISLGAVVTKNVQDGCTVSGNFAIDHNKFIEFIKKIR